MTFAEFESLLLLADRLTASNQPGKAAYGKGYQDGIKVYFGGGLQESFADHYLLAEAARRDGHRDVHSYIRGYTDGARGSKPEHRS